MILADALPPADLELEEAQRAFANAGFKIVYLESDGTDDSWLAVLTCTGCTLADDGMTARREIVNLLAREGLMIDIETFGLLHRAGDRLVVAFQYPCGRPGVLRGEPESADGQGMLFAPAL